MKDQFAVDEAGAPLWIGLSTNADLSTEKAESLEG